MYNCCSWGVVHPVERLDIGNPPDSDVMPRANTVVLVSSDASESGGRERREDEYEDDYREGSNGNGDVMEQNKRERAGEGGILILHMVCYKNTTTLISRHVGACTRN